jgi:hypothetical protein
MDPAHHQQSRAAELDEWGNGSEAMAAIGPDIAHCGLIAALTNGGFVAWPYTVGRLSLAERFCFAGLSSRHAITDTTHDQAAIP